VISSRTTIKDDDSNNVSYPKKKYHVSSSSTRRSSRKNRVHPAAMLNVEDNNSNSNAGGLSINGGSQQQQQRRSSKSYKKKPNLTVDTSADNNNTPSCNTPSGARGSKDLRSPGMPKTPVVASPSSAAIPDFITQTDASGNATTPRSAQAIEGAARAATKIHPQTTLGNIYSNSGDDDENDSDSSKDMMTETCDTIADSFRLMCCCLVQSELDDDANNPKSICAKATLDSEENTDNHIVTTQNDNIPRLLGPIHRLDTGKKCLVLDLDETLVHSSFRAVAGADFVIPVQIEDVVHFVYVAKRPGVDEFLIEMAKHYEIVIYTASLNKYADPLLDLLDPQKTIRYRLFRESCAFYEGNYVKDLSVLDRDLSSTIIIDNSPNSYLFHPENAIDCSSFIDDPRDRELDQIGSFLTGIKDAKDVRGICHQWRDWPVINPIEEEDRNERR